VNPHQQYAAALAIAVGRLMESPAGGEAAEGALASLLALADQYSVAIRLYSGRMTVDEEVIEDEVLGAEFLRRRLAMHSVAELVIARGAEADEMLAVVRGLAADAGHGRIKEKLRDAGSSRVMVIVEKNVIVERPPQRSVADAFAKVKHDDAAKAEWDRFLLQGAQRERTIDVGIPATGPDADAPGAIPPSTPQVIAEEAISHETPPPEASYAPPLPPPPASPVSRPTLAGTTVLGMALADLAADPYGPDLLTRLSPVTRFLQEALKNGNVPEAIDALSQLVELEAGAPDGARSGYVATFNRIFNGAVATQVAPYLLDPRRAERTGAILQRAGGSGADVLVDLVATAQSLPERLAYFNVIREFPRAVDSVLKLLTHGEWQVVRNVAELVGEARLEESVTMLSALLDHQEQRVRRTAAIALAKLSTAPAVEPLRRLFKESTPEMKAAMAQAIGGEIGRAMAAPLLALAESESNADVAREYLAALGRIGTVGAIQALQKMTEAGGKLLARRPLHVRLGAIEGLRLAQAVAPLEALLQDSDKSVREAAAAALHSLGSGAA
jgi:HEAT repeat protein